MTVHGIIPRHGGVLKVSRLLSPYETDHCEHLWPTKLSRIFAPNQHHSAVFRPRNSSLSLCTCGAFFKPLTPVHLTFTCYVESIIKRGVKFIFINIIFEEKRVTSNQGDFENLPVIQFSKVDLRAKELVPGVINLCSTQTHTHTLMKMWRIQSKIVSNGLMERSTLSSSQQEYLDTLVFIQLWSYCTSPPSCFLCD